MTSAIMPDSLQTRYQEVCDRVGRAAQKSGRKAGDVILVAVTKHADPEQIKTLLQLGHRDFGENKAQLLIQHAAIVEEFFTRQVIHQNTRKVRSAEAAEMLFRPATGVGLSPHVGQPNSREGLRWHMIGHLQRNKAKKIVDIARLIHSLDSLRLAEELQAIALRKDQPIDVLLQVNCSGEASKFGCLPAAAIPLAEQLATMIDRLHAGDPVGVRGGRNRPAELNGQALRRRTGRVVRPGDVAPRRTPARPPSRCRRPTLRGVSIQHDSSRRL